MLLGRGSNITDSLQRLNSLFVLIRLIFVLAGPTDRRTDGWTDRVTYRVTCTRLKIPSRVFYSELTRGDDGVGPNHILNTETFVLIDPVRPRVRPDKVVNVFLGLFGVNLGKQMRNFNCNKLRSCRYYSYGDL